MYDSRKFILRYALHAVMKKVGRRAFPVIPPSRNMQPPRQKRAVVALVTCAFTLMSFFDHNMDYYLCSDNIIYAMQAIHKNMPIFMP